MTEKKETRAEMLERLIKPLAQFAPQLAVAERRKARVLDVGILVEQLRPLVHCAVEITEKEATHARGIKDKQTKAAGTGPMGQGLGAPKEGANV
jgi:hypothetical protein